MERNALKKPDFVNYQDRYQHNSDDQEKNIRSARDCRFSGFAYAAEELDLTVSEDDQLDLHSLDDYEAIKAEYFANLLKEKG